MKNYRYVGILLVFVIMAAVSVAGCTNTSSPSVTATQAATGTAAGTVTPAATTTSSGSTLTTLGSAMDLSKVNWYEYQMTSTSAGTPTTMKIREDFGVTYNGQKANKASITTDSTQAGTTTTTAIEMYMDPSNQASLGGHMTTSSNGVVISQMDLPASSASIGSTNSSNALVSNSGATLSSGVPDSVTVPAGTFAATKYTVANTDGSTGTVWVAPNVPIPVKYTGSSSGATTEMVLTGWG